MNKQFEKNRLDLAYNKQLHYLNAILLFGTVGILSFIGTFIWKRELLFQGLIISVSILLIVYFWHYKIDNSLKSISNEIRRLN